jgi:hypothetical protein
VLALENDGNPLPPNVVSRIELFAHNVQRHARVARPSAEPERWTLGGADLCGAPSPGQPAAPHDASR